MDRRNFIGTMSLLMGFGIVKKIPKVPETKLSDSCVPLSHGDKKWYENGKFHREDGPMPCPYVHMDYANIKMLPIVPDGPMTFLS